jgi:hypothetical protein
VKLCSGGGLPITTGLQVPPLLVQFEGQPLSPAPCEWPLGMCVGQARGDRGCLLLELLDAVGQRRDAVLQRSLPGADGLVEIEANSVEVPSGDAEAALGLGLDLRNPALADVDLSKRPACGTAEDLAEGREVRVRERISDGGAEGALGQDCSASMARCALFRADRRP